MSTTFNTKYDKYVAELPKYVLNSIKCKIIEKYPLDTENEFIDAVFESKYQSFLRKRDYDKKYYTKMKTNIDKYNEKDNEMLLECQKKLEESQQSLADAKKDMFSAQLERDRVLKENEQLRINFRTAVNAFKILAQHHENLNLPPLKRRETRLIKQKLNILD
jgi:hypothetical protein